jgi:hypothetical protein
MFHAKLLINEFETSSRGAVRIAHNLEHARTTRQRGMKNTRSEIDVVTSP